MRGQRQGKYGFHRHNVVKRLEVVNVGDLDLMADQDDVCLDFAGTKILGSGTVSKKLVVSASGFSKAAREKIEAVGGKAVELDESEES